jgi:hypothetical protein
MLSSRLAAYPLGSAWFRWLPTVFAFPFGGLLTRTLVGPADHFPATLLGGALFGVVLGAAQAIALRPRVAALPWVSATAAGLAVGVALGAAVVDYRTGVADLALQGGISGAALGAAQLIVLSGRLPGAWRWAPLTAVAWTLGWAVTYAAGVDVERHYYNVGMSGALVATILTGILAIRLMRDAAVRRPAVAGGATA